MNNDDLEQPREYSDATVTAAYRELADEKTPGHLDAKIMQAARNEVANRTGIFRITAWMRPLAFAATAGLSIALLLELNESQVFDLSIDNQTPMPASGSSSAGLPDTAATDREDTDNFRDAAGLALEQVREVGASEDATLKEMPKSDSEDDKQEMAQQESPAVDGAAAQQFPADPAAEVEVERAKSSVAESSACTDEQRNNPGDWMACIDELERAGLTAVAARELTELRQSFPHFLVQ